MSALRTDKGEHKGEYGATALPSESFTQNGDRGVQAGYVGSTTVKVPQVLSGVAQQQRNLQPAT